MQARLDEHRRVEQARAEEGNRREITRARATASLKLHLAACKTLPLVLRKLGIVIDGDPLPSTLQIMKYAPLISLDPGAGYALLASCWYSPAVLLPAIIVMNRAWQQRSPQ